MASFDVMTLLALYESRVERSQHLIASGLRKLLFSQRFWKQIRLRFLLSSAILKRGRRSGMPEDIDVHGEHENIIKEIVELERSYFFEKRNVKTERQRKLRDVIERHTKTGGVANDS